MIIIACLLIVGIGFVLLKIKEDIEEIKKVLVENNTIFNDFLDKTSELYASSDSTCRDEILSATQDLKDLTKKIDEVSRKIKVIQKESKNKKVNK